MAAHSKMTLHDQLIGEPCCLFREEEAFKDLARNGVHASVLLPVAIVLIA